MTIENLEKANKILERMKFLIKEKRNIEGLSSNEYFKSIIFRRENGYDYPGISSEFLDMDLFKTFTTSKINNEIKILEEEFSKL